MSIEEIESRIPHRPPMRLLDEIVQQDDSSIVCRKTFHADEFFFQGHFPDQPLVPGVIQCECCLQAGAVLLSAQNSIENSTEHSSEDEDAAADGGSVPVATRMDSVKFKRMVRPGDTVEIHVTLNERVSNAYYMTGKVMLAGKLAARLDFACSIASPGPSSASSSEANASAPEATDSGATP